MTTQERFLQETARLRAAVYQAIHDTAERWFNIALRFDYVSLALKERADELLRTQDEILRFHACHAIAEQHVADVVELTELVSNTRFSPFILQSVSRELGQSPKTKEQSI